MPDNLEGPKMLTAQLRLLGEAEAGQLEGLNCPSCHEETVSVWFTHPAADSYRSWFLCAACGFRCRAQATSKPSFFSEQRRRPEFDAHDATIHGQTIFKLPRSD